MSLDATSRGSDALAPVVQPAASASLKAMAADPRTTNALLLILVLCVSGYMPEQMESLCGF